jgi:hypothetical protein
VPRDPTALDDAGIEPGEVDGFASYTMEQTDEVEIAKNIGAGGVTFFSQIPYGGGAGPAASAISRWRSRPDSAASAWRGGRASAGRAAGRGPAPRRRARMRCGRGRTDSCVPVDEIALLTRRYMHEYGATRDHLANVAIAVRKAANRNPRAIMHAKPLTRDEYMAARWISEPLCLFDNCLETDGALACVLVSAERARDCRQKPVYLHAFAQGLPAQHHTMVNYWCDDPLRGPAWTCAEQLYRGSEIRPEDVDVAPALRRVQPADPALARGLWLLQARRGRGVHRARQPRGRRPAPDQHLGRRPVRGLRARLQPDQRGRAPASRRLDEPGGRRRNLPRDRGRRRPHERDAAAQLSERRVAARATRRSRAKDHQVDDPRIPPIDEDAAPFYEGCREGVLRIQQCAETGA